MIPAPSDATLQQSVIRIHDAEYDGINPGVFTHFNLAVAGHAVGCWYSLPRIIRPGRDPHEPPELDFRDIWIGRCVEFVRCKPFHEIGFEYFRDSMTHIQDAADLKAVIWKRYSRSRPGLTWQDMLETGISITVLELDKRRSLY